MVRGVVLCADLGAGSLRVGAITANGTLAASAASAIRAREPAAGWSVVAEDRQEARQGGRKIAARPAAGLTAADLAHLVMVGQLPRQAA